MNAQEIYSSAIALPDPFDTQAGIEPENAQVFYKDQNKKLAELNGNHSGYLDSAFPLINKIVHASGAKIRHTGTAVAATRPEPLHIELPFPQSFKTPEFYGRTTLHELAHWTGHSGASPRDMPTLFDRFVGLPTEHLEELTVEIAVLTTQAELGIIDSTHYSMHYIRAWIDNVGLLKNSKITAQDVVDKAAARAEGIVAYFRKLARE